MVWAGLVVAAGFARVLAGYAWLARRIRRSGVGGALMDPFDEVWNPGRHRFREVVAIEEQRALPVESPGDPGRIRPDPTR